MFKFKLKIMQEEEIFNRWSIFKISFHILCIIVCVHYLLICERSEIKWLCVLYLYGISPLLDRMTLM